MRSLSKSEFESLTLADSELVSIEWLNAGRDLRVVLCCKAHLRQTFLFPWTTSLHVELDQGPFGVSPPFTFQVTVEKLSPSGFHILIDFGGAPHGEIAFNCNEILLVGPPAEAA